MVTLLPAGTLKAPASAWWRASGRAGVMTRCSSAPQRRVVGSEGVICGSHGDFMGILQQKRTCAEGLCIKCEHAQGRHHMHLRHKLQEAHRLPGM